MAESSSPEFLALQQALAGRFSLEREIGRGGMGIVYLARDVALDRPVAIKLLPSDLGAHADLRDRFLREARTAAQLSHPNIVPIHLVEERDGLVYFVMALIDGESLGDRVRRSGPLNSGDAIRMIQEVAWALGYAHDRGVVHRDVKPDNVMIERASGRAMLTDFGIAQSAHAGPHTTPGLVLGSLQYMAPEQADAEARTDGRADIYALGVTAFFALTGRLPFESDRQEALLLAHMIEAPPPLAALLPGAPTRLAESVDRCLAKDPAARWPTGGALADALGEVGQNVRAMPPAIRAFVYSVSSAVGQISLLIIVSMLSLVVMPEQASVVLKLLAATTILPLLTVFEGARAVAIAGFRPDDVAQAIIADARASDRYTEYLRSQVSRLASDVRSRGSRTFAGIIGAGMFLAAGGLLFDRGGTLRHWWQYLVLGGLVSLLLWLGVELVGHASQLGPFRDRLVRFSEANHRRLEWAAKAVWSSPPVRWILALGRLGAGKRKPTVAAVENRPTEVLLASAVAEVFAGLAPEERKALDAVPQVIGDLETHAAGLRARKESLDAAISAVGEPGVAPGRLRAIAEMEAARDRVAEQLRSTVEAMENLRLDLLRLRVGVGSTAELNDAIDRARSLGRDIDYTLQGRADVARIPTPV